MLALLLRVPVGAECPGCRSRAPIHALMSPPCDDHACTRFLHDRGAHPLVSPWAMDGTRITKHSGNRSAVTDDFDDGPATRVDLSGDVLKRGRTMKAWQKRYFKLNGNVIEYFPKKGSPPSKVTDDDLRSAHAHTHARTHTHTHTHTHGCVHGVDGGWWRRCLLVVMVPARPARWRSIVALMTSLWQHSGGGIFSLLSCR